MTRLIDFKRLPGRFRSFFFTASPLLVLLHGYLGWQLLPSLSTAPITLLLGIALLSCSCVLTPAGLFARFVILSDKLADRVSLVGFITMGWFSTLLILTFLRNALLLFVDDASIQAPSALLVVVLSLAVTVIGFVNARTIARVKRVTILIDALPPSLVGFKIVQLSDIHVGSSIKSAYVKGIVDRVNSLRPDKIAITGDVVDGTVAKLGIHTAHLSRLKSRHGTYLVTGNHEYYSGADEWIKEFTRLGIKCLINEHIVLDHDGAQLLVAGVTDYSAHQFIPTHRSDPLQAVVGAPSGVIRLLLAHQPRSSAAAQKAGFHLQLSGHTHGGQFWPWNLFVPMQQPFVAGLTRMGNMWVYTSRGTGYWGPPKRFGAPSEITLITLAATSNSQASL